MASLRLTFPEKDQPTVIALTGARLTIGRLPFNTIQIIDRTISGFHAELISEHGHYRLHDRGSSNGTFVNGQKVSDYHLTETCTIAFGTVEAEFNPEPVSSGEEAETFPTRTEINGVRQENVELRATVAALREEADALRLVKPVENGEVALAVGKEDFDKVVIERETLKEAKLKQDEEISRLKADLAVLKRDRVNLQLAYDSVQRELTEMRAKAGGEIGLAPKAAAAVLDASTPTAEAVRVEVPKAAQPAVVEEPKEVTAEAPKAEEPVAEKAPEPAAPAAPTFVKVAPKAPGLPSAPSAPSLPKAPTAPAAPLAPAAPATGVKPFAPLPKAPGIAAPKPAMPATAVPANAATPATPKPPGSLPSGIRPLGKPAVAVPTGNSAVDGKTLPIASVPTPRPGGIRPLPAVKLPAQPVTKAGTAPIARPAAGPKGTQKLSE